MASQSVLELAVNTGKWDSGLRKAQAALNNFTTASGGLQQALGKDADKMGTFVRMMGQMESKAKTGKGQMNDYKSTIEQLTMQYNRMTEAQQKTIGQDYLRAIEQMRQKYQAVNQELQQMNRSLSQSASVPSGESGGGGTSGMLAVFGGNMMTKAAGLALNFASDMASAVQEGIELAKAGEGIRNAFERLGRGDILDGLREATHGTVTDIELMKAAVKFNDFKLPVEELGTMLAFAQQKAKDTGQSVDYMVDSIVTGLGRKSLMILDNLGLSAAEIKDKMAETGDMTKAVGEIIREQMSKAGDYVETAADRATKANVDLKNAMDDLGRTLIPLQEAGVSMFNSWKIAAVKFLNSTLKPIIETFTRIGRMNKAYGMMGGDSTVDAQIQALAGSKNQRADYFLQLGTYRGTNQGLNRAIRAIEAWQRGDRSESTSRAVENVKQTYGLTSLNTAPLRAALDANTKMMEEYEAKALAILEPVNDDIIPKIPKIPKKPKDSKKTPEIFPENSLKSLTAEMQELQKAQQLVTSADEWRTYEYAIEGVKNQIKELKGELSDISTGNMASLAKIKGVSIADSITLPTRDSIIEKGQKHISNFKAPEQPTKQEVKLTDIMGQMNSGISSMVSGIEGLGIEIPNDIKNMLGALNSITMILTSIEAFQKVGTMLGIFSHGGVVRAASGYRVPGNSFSGDMIPARLNAGELVLNQAQAGIIGSALQDRDFGGGMSAQPYVDGEKIFLGMNNTSKRMGRGEIVTTSMLRRMGLMN